MHTCCNKKRKKEQQDAIQKEIVLKNLLSSLKDRETPTQKRWMPVLLDRKSCTYKKIKLNIQINLKSNSNKIS